MESSGTPLPIPRLRLTRQSQKFNDGLDDTPQAGPSRLSPNGHRAMADIGGHENNDAEDDAQSTPKMPIIESVFPEPTSTQNATPPTMDTPAARLRALLSRVPNSPTNSRVSPQAHVPSSEPDSDFDPPRSSPTNTPSIARESLKDLFSRALRDPGDTPQKNRSRRRNSIDVSEVGSSPRVERERATNNGKRRSLSDEEADKPSRSGTSLRSSQATTFDILRARLTNSQTQLMDQAPPFDDHTSAHSSRNTTFLQQLEHPPATPPAATSTPHGSMQLLSQSNFQSNLLEQDLEMQNAMKDFDSFEDDSGPSQRPLSFPPARTPQAPYSTPARPLSQASGSKVHSASGVHGARRSSLSRHGSADLTDGGSSRASSSLSHADFNNHEREQELNREREREWNKPHPHPKTPELHHRHSYSHGSKSGGTRSASPMLNLTNRLGRRGSVTSLKSLDDGRSSRTSSFGSQAEYRERINELETERNVERERQWNKRHATTQHTSSFSIHSHSPNHPERTRTQSHPARPDSATSYRTPDYLHRHNSFNSVGSSSPSSSVRSHDSEKGIELEVKHEVEHVRERNWNAPRPKWDPNAPHHHERSVSPLPPSLSPRSSISHMHADSHSHNLHASSPRIKSPARRLEPGKSTSRPSSSNSSLNVKDRTSLRSPSPLPHSAKGKQPTSSPHPTDHASRPRSPLPQTDHADLNTKEKEKESGSASKISATGSRFGWQFPRNKAPLPPLELEQHSPERYTNPVHSRTLSSPSPTPGSRPTSRISGSAKTSHIPVRSPQVSERNAGSSSALKKHKRNTTELSESVAEIPPQISAETAPFTQDKTHQDSVLASDEELPSTLPTNTPTMRPMLLPGHPVSLPGSPPSAPLNNDEAHPQKVLARPSSFDRSSPRPWPPPPSEPSLSLTTPPRRQTSSSPKVEFETPPPPKGMPELPGPPSSSEDESETEKGWVPAGQDAGSHPDFSSMKTPKPPGAWGSTPLLSRRDHLVRAHTLSDSDGFVESTSESGLATPVASLSRAFSLPAQTPAPPGAWLVTPGTDRRRSVLKVRFDVESEQSAQSASEVPANGHAHVGNWDDPQTESLNESSFEVSTPKAQANGLPGVVEVKEEGIVTPVTPRSTPPPSLRKSPSIRVVDAFGREQIQSNEDDSVPSTPRSKSSVRIVDAMGREVEEVAETTSSENKSEGDIILGHNEALRRVRQSIADLASGLNEVDSSGTELEPDEKRLDKLNDVSRAARDRRHKLSQMVQNADNDLRSKYGSLRASMKKSKLLPAIVTGSRLPWTQNNALIFWGVVFIQVVLIIIMYRVSTARAKDIFLNTYYDPYYPELHLYVMKPDTFRLSMSHASHWSIFSIPDTLQRGGWKAAASEAWNGLGMVVWDWQRQVWDTWGAVETVSWPPT